MDVIFALMISGQDVMNETLDEPRFYANLGFLPLDV